jgi:hypothetical protein
MIPQSGAAEKVGAGFSALRCDSHARRRRPAGDRAINGRDPPRSGVCGMGGGLGGGFVIR